MIKVLLFAANPRGSAPLDLPREFREIEQEVRLGAFRDALELVLVPGARPVDLLRKLNECRPQVVHFSSHGSPEEILLEAQGGEEQAADLPGTSTRSTEGRDIKKVAREEGEGAASSQAPPQPVSRSALVEVLRACDEGELRLVVLNACDTRPQAEALTEVVDCVVSMDREVTDRAAIKFAASFYGALAYGRSVRRAFDQGVARLRAEGLAGEGTPELLVRAGVDASRVVLVGQAPAQPVPPAAEAPFHVPFPRNGDFVGRDGDLARLHACLSGPGPVGIRPAGLTGMGGHRQDPARRQVRPPAPGRLPGRRLLDRRGRSPGRRLRPAGNRSPPRVGRERSAPRRADPGGVRRAQSEAACAAGAR
jgi:hypothetical protein